MSILLAFLILAVLSIAGIVIGVLVLRRQRDVRRFEPMFERLLSEMQVELKTRETMRMMRQAAHEWAERSTD